MQERQTFFAIDGLQAESDLAKMKNIAANAAAESKAHRPSA